MAGNALSATQNAQLEQLLAQLEAEHTPQNDLMAGGAGRFAAPGLADTRMAYNRLPQVSASPAPGLRERLARAIIGDRAPTVAQERSVGRMLGTTGVAGDQGFGLVDLLPVTHAVEAGESIADGRYGDAALGAGAAALGTASLGGPAIRGAGDVIKGGYNAVRNALSASPAATGAAAAGIGATTGSATAESPTTALKAEYGTPIPSPPTRPPELDVYIERSLAAARADIDKRNEQSRKVSEETGRRFKPEVLDPKREADIRARAGADYKGLSSAYEGDMRKWEGDRTRIIGEDRKSYNDKSFAERNPTAAAAMMTAGYVLPPLLTKGIWKGRYAQGDKIVKDAENALGGRVTARDESQSTLSRLAFGNRQVPTTPPGETDVNALTNAVARGEEWLSPKGIAARTALTVPAAALPAESRMAMDYWDRAMMPEDSAAYKKGKEATTWDLPKVGNFLMQSVPGMIGAASGMKMAGVSPGNDLRMLSRYNLDAADPASMASIRSRVEANLGTGRSTTGAAGLPSGGGPSPVSPAPPGIPPGTGPAAPALPPPPASSPSSSSSSPHWATQHRDAAGRFAVPPPAKPARTPRNALSPPDDK